MPLRRYIAGPEEIGFIDPGTAISIVSSVFASLKNLFGQDQVPEYPIRSGDTLKKILAEIQPQFPDPANLSEAYALLDKINYFIQDAVNKGAYQWKKEGDPYAVVTTYAMIFEKIKEAYEKYIAAYGDTEPSGGVVQPPSTTSPGPTPPIKQPPVPPTVDTKKNVLSTLALVAGGLFLLAPKKKKVNGISNDTLLMLGLGAGAFYMFTKNSRTNEKRIALLNKGNAEDPSGDLAAIFYKMTDQEISDTYELLFNYEGGDKVPDGPLRDRLLLISQKYNIFT